MATPTNIASAYVEIRADDSKFKQDIQGIKGQLASTGAIQPGFISKKFASEFTTVSKAAMMMSRQISAIIKLAYAPVAGIAAKSLHSLFTSDSEAGKQARRRMDPLKKSMEESMVRIGYYTSQAKIFGRNMYEWTDVFAQKISKITRTDVEAFVKMLERAAIAMGAIKAFSIGVKLINPAMKLGSKYGGGNQATEAATGLVAGASGGLGAAIGSNYTNVTKPLGFAAIEAQKKASATSFMTAPRAIGVAALGTWVAMIAAIATGITGIVGAIANAKIGKEQTSVIENQKTGWKVWGAAFKGLYAVIDEFFAIIGTASAFQNEAETAKLQVRRRQDMWSWIGGGPELDPTVYLSNKERRSISRNTKSEVEPSFKPNYEADYQYMVSQMQGKYLSERLEREGRYNEAIADLDRKRISQALETSRRIEDLNEETGLRNLRRSYNEEDYTRNVLELGKGLNMPKGSDTSDVVTKALQIFAANKDSQMRGYTGQKVGYTELGAMSTSIQVDISREQLSIAKQLVDINREKMRSDLDILNENKRIAVERKRSEEDLVIATKELIREYQKANKDTGQDDSFSN